jgi:hypothetical protein
MSSDDHSPHHAGPKFHSELRHATSAALLCIQHRFISSSRNRCTETLHRQRVILNFCRAAPSLEDSTCRYCNWNVAGSATGAAIPARGKDYVQEDIRRLCLWHALHDKPAHQSEPFSGQQAWWAYVVAFGRTCSGADGTITEECSSKVLLPMLCLKCILKSASCLLVC